MSSCTFFSVSPIIIPCFVFNPYKTFYRTGIEPALAHCNRMCNQWATTSSMLYTISVYFLFSIPPSLFPALCSITIKPFTGLESNPHKLHFSRMCNQWATTSSKLQYIPQYKYYISVYFSFQYPTIIIPCFVFNHYKTFYPTGIEPVLAHCSRMCNQWVTTSSKLQYIPQNKYYISAYFSFQYPHHYSLLCVQSL
jgi:hypothetical protein